MRRVLAVTLLVTLLSVPSVAAGLAATDTGVPRGSPPADSAPVKPSIEAVYPNPVTENDAGEFVVLSVPPGANLSGYTLADDHASVPLPNVSGGRVTLSTNVSATQAVLDRQVLPLPDSLALANSGEQLALRRNGSLVDVVSYSDAPEGDLLVTDDNRTDWRPLGATNRPAVAAGPGTARTFVLPDGAQAVTQALSAADDRILLAGYTITSRRVADTLLAAARQGVRVEVLIEGSPVGGMTRRQARLLDRLQGGGVEVTVLGGDRARYAFHHAKYAVVDDRALVTTENWKPAGVGGHASRGWGAIVDHRPISEALADTFHADVTALDARPWSEVRAGKSFSAARNPPANDSYPGRFSPEVAHVERARLLVAPDNAEAALVSVLGNATRSVDVQQVSLGGPNHPLVCATLDAARRGVEVRILLSSAWYVREDNRRMVDWLTERARRSNLPLKARLTDPRGRFEKVHTKGVVVDGEQAIVGSLNWNNNSLRNNREVVLILDDETATNYYEGVFEADWTGGVWSVTGGLVVTLALAVAVAAVRARRIEFDG